MMPPKVNELFTIKRADDWINGARSRPAPKMIFDRFWLEGEISVLFATTGQGKNVLGVQIAEAIARGHDIEPFRMQMPPQKVLYFDLELSDKQFETRYAADIDDEDQAQQQNHYQFP